MDLGEVDKIVRTGMKRLEAKQVPREEMYWLSLFTNPLLMKLRLKTRPKDENSLREWSAKHAPILEEARRQFKLDVEVGWQDRWFQQLRHKRS